MSTDKSATAGNESAVAQALRSVETAPVVTQAKESPVVQKGLNPLREFMAKVNNDWTMNLQASALAYSLLMAMLPIAVALLSIFGLVLGGFGHATQDAFINTLTQVLPGQKSVSAGVKDAIFNKLPASSGPLLIIGTLLALFTGSRLFIMVERCFAIIYHVRLRKGLQQNIMAIGMLLIFAVLIPIMTLASSLPAILLSVLNTLVLSKIPGGGFVINVLAILTSVLIAWVLFEAIYIVVPNQHINFKHSWRGAVFAAVALQIFLVLFPFYAAHFLGGYAGQVGFALILVVFFFYFATILLIGAEVNAFFGEGIRKTPGTIADIVHTKTDLDPKPEQEQRLQATPPHKEDMSGSGHAKRREQAEKQESKRS
ncbi:MAG TPA: YihY/virulence factor BrkB family protein [Ktedonobacteraceae bacterium]|nr:YihY/virulence factor BrkB family protein [Ktedonobacteraceae bacterium]